MSLPRSALVVMAAGILAAGEADGPWPAPVPGFVAPAGGEHPRLFVRKAEVAALRQRAQTPEGKAIVARLRATLGGGEAMPTAYQASTKAYQEATKNLPEGAYTLWHGAGFGMLYQLTGETKYAELGRQCVEKAFAGQRDRDDRYSFRDPGGFLRAGPSIGAIAMAYDLCYDGWDDAFRQQVAKTLLTYDGGRTDRDGGGQQTMEKMATKVHMPPFSNHYAPQVGGVALCLLAIARDPGVDQALVDRYLASTEANVITALTKGFGDHGAFAEGEGPGVIASDTAFAPALQAFRVAGGKDFIAPRPNAPWMTLKWVYGTLPGPAFPHRGAYAHNVYARTGLSGSGTFSQGFGAIDAKHRGALLWTWNHCLLQGKDPLQGDFDAINYPQRALLALVNWPIGERAVDPGTLFPPMVADRTWGQTWFRNRWKDKDDIVISALPKGHRGYHQVPGGDCIIWGGGEKAAVAFGGGKATAWKEAPRGGSVIAENGVLGVDFSGAAGADGVVVVVGDKPATWKGGGARIRQQPVTAGAKTFTVITIAGTGTHPEVKADGDGVAIGPLRAALAEGFVVFTPR